MSKKGYTYVLAAGLLVAALVAVPLLTLAGPEDGTYDEGGYCGRGWYGSQGGPGDRREWSNTRITRMEKERERFIEETGSLRRRIAETEQALNAVVDKDTPDRARAAELQKELSGLWAQFDQKQLAHRITLRGIMRDNRSRTNLY